MTSNSAESGTTPIREVSGLSSGQAVRSRVNGLIVHRLSKDTPSARALRAQRFGILHWTVSIRVEVMPPRWERKQYTGL